MRVRGVWESDLARAVAAPRVSAGVGRARETLARPSPVLVGVLGAGEARSFPDLSANTRLVI